MRKGCLTVNLEKLRLQNFLESLLRQDLFNYYLNLLSKQTNISKIAKNSAFPKLKWQESGCARF